uniref:Cysteine and serine rich nuclear protein 1 n=1 Tax=Amphilophus citrinellus TaxID=61819 RepID=A0A3Q0RWF4_AMPCI
MRGILKRKFAEVDDNAYSSSSSPSPPSSLSSPTSSESESDGESGSSENQDFTPRSPASPTSLPTHSILKRPKLASRPSSVRFDQVTVFSFPRCQGFTSVPSRGGATLGMVRRHSSLQQYTVSEHGLEQRHRRRQRFRERRREERLKALKHKLLTSGAIDQQEADSLTVDQIPDENTDSDISDSDQEDRGFLQPFSSKQRQAILQAAGVRFIDREEKRQLHALRRSRETCGCDCQGFCELETCACSLAGIKCQVDRFNFPCGCTKDSCGNIQGRIEFDSRHVQTHYIHTVMRLELERRLQEEKQSPEDQVGLPLTMPTTPSFHFVPERLVVEENSCSSDMTESSCSSSDCDAGGCCSGGHNLPEVDGGLSRALSLCDSENNNYSSYSQVRHQRDPLTQRSSSSSSSATHSSTTDNDTKLHTASKQEVRKFMFG